MYTNSIGKIGRQAHNIAKQGRQADSVRLPSFSLGAISPLFVYLYMSPHHPPIHFPYQYIYCIFLIRPSICLSYLATYLVSHLYSRWGGQVRQKDRVDGQILQDIQGVDGTRYPCIWTDSTGGQSRQMVVQSRQGVRTDRIEQAGQIDLLFRRNRIYREMLTQRDSYQGAPIYRSTPYWVPLSALYHISPIHLAYPFPKYRHCMVWIMQEWREVVRIRLLQTGVFFIRLEQTRQDWDGLVFVTLGFLYAMIPFAARCSFSKYLPYPPTSGQGRSSNGCIATVRIRLVSAGLCCVGYWSARSVWRRSSSLHIVLRLPIYRWALVWFRGFVRIFPPSFCAAGQNS